MNKIGNKIISYFLLLSFLAISFPVSELLHEHKSKIINCFDSHNHEEESNHVEALQKKCSHDVHFSKQEEKHLCFYNYFNSPYTIVSFDAIIFRGLSFDDYLPQLTESFYPKTFQSYLLRGPPAYYLTA